MRYTDYKEFRAKAIKATSNLRTVMKNIIIADPEVYLEGILCFKKLVATWVYQFPQSTSGGTVRWDGKRFSAQRETLISPLTYGDEPRPEELSSDPHPYVQEGIDKLNELYKGVK